MLFAQGVHLALLTFASLLLLGFAAGQQVPTITRCDADLDCLYPATCNLEALIDAEDTSERGICECPPGFIVEADNQCRSLEDLPAANHSCAGDWECQARPNEVCNMPTEGYPTCQCRELHVLDAELGVCRPRVCEDFCFGAGGDTCRNGMCLRCWKNGVFSCNEFLPPTFPEHIYIYRRSSLLYVWSMSLLLVTFSFLIFGCLLRCCLGARRPATAGRMAAQQQFVNQQRRDQLEQLERRQQQQQQLQQTASDVKMPLGADNLQNSYPYQQQQLRAAELPPPYLHTSSQA